jgi:predicted nucleic acid-binding protein
MKRKQAKNHGPKLIKIFPDSSWLIALLNPKDSHHQHVRSCCGMLTPLKPKFYFSTLVIMETMSGLIKGGFRVRKAHETIGQFISKLDSAMFETPIKRDEVLDTYLHFSRARKITKLTTVDFYIATSAMLVRAKLLTADKRMYKVAKASYPETYLITDKVRGLRSDLPKLTDHVVNNIKVC